MRLSQIKIGDRIQFRSVTRHSDATVWRVVTGVEFGGQRVIQVRYHGWGDFQVRNREIFAHETRAEYQRQQKKEKNLCPKCGEPIRPGGRTVTVRGGKIVPLFPPCGCPVTGTQERGN